jgi:hypothetical protein
MKGIVADERPRPLQAIDRYDKDMKQLPPDPQTARPPRRWDPTGPLSLVIGGLVLSLAGLLLVLAFTNNCQALVGALHRPAQCGKRQLTGVECLSFPILYALLIAFLPTRQRPLLILSVGLVGMVVLALLWLVVLPT